MNCKRLGQPKSDRLLGAHPQFHPNRRGFAEFFGFLGGGHRYFPDGPVTIEVAAGHKTSDPQAQAEISSPLLRDTTAVPETGELTARLGEEAADYVTRRAAQPKPWFLYLAYNAPHTPMQATPELLEKFRAISDPGRRTYAAMTAALDASIGRVLAALDASGQRERTLVIFFSDNGGPMTKRNANHSVNTPLRGQKGDVFEGGIRVPFLVSWPDRLPAGTTFGQPVSSLDVVPTALAAAGVKLPPETAATLDGVDLAPFLSRANSTAAQPPPHERLFWRMDGGVAFALREGNWKWMRVRDEPLQLYDLAADPGERHDLSAAHPELMQRFAASAAEWNRGLITPRWANNPFGGLINLPGTQKNAQP